MDEFTQDAPRLGNQYLDDYFLRSCLRRLLPAEMHEDHVVPDLTRFGWEVATSIKALGQQAEAEEPQLILHDAWGHRIGALATSKAWSKLKQIAAEEGLVAIPYEQHYGPHSRIYQIAKLYLFGASSGLVNCPIAMTDGAAWVCQLRSRAVGHLSSPLAHLTSRDPGLAWTSGQWMTERRGGSDVATATETVAVPINDDTSSANNNSDEQWYALHGIKWFSSAADGEMALALAREVSSTPQKNGLTLFYVPLLRPAPSDCSHNELAGRHVQLQLEPHGVEIVALKNKLGTRQLPTAELRLRGVRGLKISESGRGVATIAAMVNITRLHNCAAAASFMRRITALAQDYARKRMAFGEFLADKPLHQATIAFLQIQTAASLALTLEVSRLLGLQETGHATQQEASLLRLLIPVAKAFSGKQAVAVASEGLETFGGQGYIETTGLPSILRDAQVLPIWEGTTNVLALDVLRVLRHDHSVVSAFKAAVQEACCCVEIERAWPAKNGTNAGFKLSREMLKEPASLVLQDLQVLEADMKAATEINRRTAAVGDSGARSLMMRIARIFIAGILIQHALWSGEKLDTLVAYEWCRTELPSTGLGGPFVAMTTQGTVTSPDMLAVLAGTDLPLTAPRARF